MGKNLTIFQKGLLLSTVPLLVQLAFLGVLHKLQSDLIAAEDLAVHTKDVIAQAEGTYRRMVEAQNAVRGFVLTAQPVFANTYEKAVHDLGPELDSLENMVQDNSSQQAKVRAIKGNVAKLLAWLTEQERLVKNGRQTVAAAFLRDPNEQTFLADLRQTVREFLSEEDRLDVARMAALRRTSGWLDWALAGGGVLALFTTGLLVLLFTSGVTRRLAVLRDNARRLSEGKGLAKQLVGTDEIAEVDRAFHDMADALAQKNQENELFVYSVSHDLRSPLVNLQGFSQELDLACHELRRLLAGPDIPAELRDRVRAVLEGNIAEATYFIQTAVSRLSRIIDALLRLSRAGRVEYRPQVIDVGLTVGRVVEALRGTISERGAVVRAEPLPPCWADPTAVEQIFANLIGNAVNYLDPNRPGQVEVGSAEAGPGVNPGMRVFFVRDNGMGIPEDYQKNAFTAFQRLHGDVAPGEGIGLALVRRAVERHGGKVWLESTADEGSTFYVSLPAAPPAEAAMGQAFSVTRPATSQVSMQAVGLEKDR
jgi:signal transduction histidine kinase